MWRVQLGLSGSLPGPCSTDLDRNRAPEARSRTLRLRVGRSGSSTRRRCGPWPEPDPRLSYQARAGLSRSRMWRVQLGLSGSLPGPCSTDLDRNRAPEARSRTLRLRVGWSGNPSHGKTGVGSGPTTEHQTELRLGRSRMTRYHASVCHMC